ncbi:uncharacterized protein [Montipora capricornis]|uniref:uncharacterized protein n=1 Tax=Montipora capricornis TaxID=246305 RepID=UPI0035F18D7D
MSVLYLNRCHEEDRVSEEAKNNTWHSYAEKWPGILHFTEDSVSILGGQNKRTRSFLQGCIRTLFDVLLLRRRQFPSYSAAKRGLQPMLQAIPKPLTSKRQRQENEAVVTLRKSAFNKVA